MIVPVLLSGGSGSRLWPVSRKSYPKQFIPLFDDGLSSLQSTWNRLAGLDIHLPPLIVGADDHRFIIAEQMRQAGCQNFNLITEPIGRNTAPATAIAAFHMLAQGEDPLLLILPADHVITDTDGFCEAVLKTKPQASAGQLVVFGIQPQSPHTGYGYIHAKKAADASHQTMRVDRFVEKPDLDNAKRYLESGEYYWNSGMFMFQASAYLQELKTHAPNLYKAVEDTYQASKVADGSLSLDQVAFEACEDISIDYAVMEKTDNAVVYPLDCGWDDIGSWASLSANLNQDDDGNTLVGDAMAIDCHDTYVHSDHRLTTAVGVDNLVVIETRDAVMVTNKSASQDVKTLVSTLKSIHRPEAIEHSRGYRPWGYYDSLEISEGFQVKRIVVNPGQQLSLQLHHHRSEHWIVLQGTAEITNGTTVTTLKQNESTYIPAETKHRLANRGTDLLEIIEVQVGSYLGEDDIVRFEDVYGRDAIA